jgi:single-strand DNA-binding protein
VLAGTVSADPVQRRMPSGDEVTELRLSVPEAGKRLLPLPIAAWHATVGDRALDEIAKGDRVLVHGQLVRRFYRSGGELEAGRTRRASPRQLRPELSIVTAIIVAPEGRSRRAGLGGCTSADWC